MGDGERAAALEREILDGLRQLAIDQALAVRAAARATGELDALASLAETARREGWTRPVVDDGTRIEIRGGRHPVVEAVLRGRGGDAFVPNDTELDPDDAQLLLLTGPNMSGKSTYLRQVALIVLLAQVGSFVPAEAARIGAVDRVFTRVGASDRLARGESTFMVEMRETAEILSQASGRSLVILDEIGRGTSTYDGLAIAWAVAEYLHDTPGLRPRTLFATHYHELTDLAQTKARVRNAHFEAREWRDEVVFLRRLVPGGANRSYGIQVARLAGLPGSVIERARAILGQLEQAEGPTRQDDGQLGLFAGQGTRRRARALARGSGGARCDSRPGRRSHDAHGRAGRPPALEGRARPALRRRRRRLMRTRLACAIPLALLLPLLLGVERPSGLGDVTDVRFWSYPDYTRVVVELTRETAKDVDVRRLPADAKAGRPERLYLDLPKIWVGRRFVDGIPVSDGLLQGLRLGQNTLAVSRLVIDLERYQRHRLLMLRSPDRVVVDVYGSRGPGDPGAARPGAGLAPVDAPAPDPHGRHRRRARRQGPRCHRRGRHAREGRQPDDRAHAAGRAREPRLPGRDDPRDRPLHRPGGAHGHRRIVRR